MFSFLKELDYYVLFLWNLVVHDIAENFRSEFEKLEASWMEFC